MTTTGETGEGRRPPGRPRKAWAPSPSTAAAAPRPVVRAVGYVRVSSDDQAANGYGLDAQRAAILAHAAARGWQVVAVEADPGASGTYGLDDRDRAGAWRRPGLRAALAAVEEGRADALIVTALDRIGRAPAVCVATFGRLDAAGATFASIAEPALSSDLLRGLYAGIASDERRRILARTRDGRMAMVAAGRIPGRLPYGYRRVEGGRPGVAVVEEGEAAVVRRIHAMRAAGATQWAIADALAADGIPAPSGGAAWHQSAVRRILDNPAYRGAPIWREGAATRVEAMREGALPAILPVAPFRADADLEGRATAAAA